MQVWAAGCADRARELLKEIDEGERSLIATTSLHICIDPDDVLQKGGSLTFTAKDVPWGVERTDWYVIVRATPDVLKEVVTLLKGLDLMPRNDTTLWVLSGKMPASERRALPK